MSGDEMGWESEAPALPWVRLAQLGQLRPESSGGRRGGIRWQVFQPYNRTLAEGEAETLEEAMAEAEDALHAAAQASGEGVVASNGARLLQYEKVAQACYTLRRNC